MEKSQVSGPACTFLILSLLLVLLGVLILQVILRPGSFRPVFKPLVVESAGPWWKKALAVNRAMKGRIDVVEKVLDEELWLADALRSHTQTMLSRWGGHGNEQVYAGTDSWLYFRPGVDYLTGPGFLDPEHLSRRQANDPSIGADPRPAVRAFARDLDALGIQLVLVPVPTKAMIHPEGLGQSDESSVMLQNASFDQWVREMEEEGIVVFDSSAVLWSMPEFAGPRFLKGDSHWTPGAMQAVAEGLGVFLRARFPDRLPAFEASYDRQERLLQNRGDLRRMLGLSGDGAEGLESVSVFSVNDGGRPWEADLSSKLLLLGDSFANIYSLGGMGWGADGGLGEQLSLSLGFPIDRISMNAGGAYGARLELVQSLARGEDRLRGKTLVVWEFAMRELTSGDWRILPLPEVGKSNPGQQQTEPPSAGWKEAEGDLSQNSGMPDPREVLYKDGVTQFHLTGVQAAGQPDFPGEVVVMLWGMRDRVLTGAGAVETGQRLKLRLLPWAEAESLYGGYERTELEDPDLRLLELPLYWGEWTGGEVPQP